MAELTQNPISFPWQMFMEAQKMKNQNQQDMYGNIGGIGKGLGTIGQTVEQQKAKMAIQKFLESQRTPGAQTAGAPGAQGQNTLMSLMLPYVNSDTAGQLLPPMMKSEKQPNVFRPFPSMMSEDNNPLIINEATGEVKPAGIKGKSTTRPFASDLGEVKWETATPDEQQLAISLYNGDIRPYDLGYRERSKAVVLANEYANRNKLPAYQSFAGDVKGKSTVAFTSGKPALNTLALNTALGHLDSAFTAYEKLGNTDQNWLNMPMNALKEKTNDPNIGALMATLNAVRGESAAVFKNSGATDQEISTWKQSINENLTPVQYMAVIKQMDELYRSRLSALEYMRNSGMGNRPGNAPLLSPHAKKVSKKLSTAGDQSSGWSYVGAAQ